MRIGIFGGTFNPVHLGHLMGIEFIRTECLLDRIIIVPARAPVHKEVACATPAADRVNMVRLAIEGNESLSVSLMEIERESPSYTISTVDDLIRLHPGASLSLIVGSDSFNEIDTWKDYERLLSLVSLIVMNRGAEPVFRNGIRGECRGLVHSGNPVIGISSTMIRDRVRNSLGIRYMVPGPVEEYIYKKGLYLH